MASQRIAAQEDPDEDYVGPLINQAARDKVQSYMEIARQEGAQATLYAQSAAPEASAALIRRTQNINKGSRD